MTDGHNQFFQAADSYRDCMSTSFWLARHAETATPHVFHGAESDIGLGTHGIRQATAAVDWFAKEIRPTRIVTSTMKRSIETATILSQAMGVPTVIAENLHERRVGALGGTSFSGSDGPWPETIRNWCAGDCDYTTEGAESFADLQRRLLPAIEAVFNRWPDDRILIIAHGIVCKVVLLSLLTDWGITGWERMGHSLNLATSELIRSETGSWSCSWMHRLPPGVQAVNDDRKAKLSSIEPSRA
jgi:2,3-bisphosphoglycerate-dependent phosphoglycerate mutase